MGGVSDTEPVTSEAPQGSVLGPVSFNTFINHVVDSVNKFTMFLFANHTLVYNPILMTVLYLNVSPSLWIWSMFIAVRLAYLQEHGNSGAVVNEAVNAIVWQAN